LQSRQAQTPHTPGLNGPDAADIHAKLKRVLANAAEERGKAAQSPGGTAAAESSLPLNLCCNEAEKRRICNLLNARPGDYPCGLLICDAMERGVPVVYANGYLEDATGYAQHEILGRPYNFAQRRGVYATAEHELVDRTTSAELATALQKVGVPCIISGSPPHSVPANELGSESVGMFGRTARRENLRRRHGFDIAVFSVACAMFARAQVGCPLGNG
jgi:hypothetical protein